MNELSEGIRTSGGGKTSDARPMTSTASVDLVYEALRERSHRQRGRIDEALARLFQGATLLDRAVRQALFGEAKRVRASLALMATEAAGGSPDAAMPMAVAFELGHTASLIHDDIMDGSHTRRGRPCVHVTFGVDIAITAGDALIFEAYQQILALSSHFAAERVGEVLRIFTAAAMKTCRGQAADLRFPLETATMEDYLAMVDGKTGSMMVAPLEGGAVLAGAPEATRAALRDYGTSLGIAFQIVDDAIDYLGSEEKARKTVGNDLRRNAASPILIHCRDRSDEAERGAMARAIGAYKASADPADLAPVFALFREYDAVGFTHRLSQQYAERCVKALSSLVDGPGAADLRAIAATVGAWGRRDAPLQARVDGP